MCRYVLTGLVLLLAAPLAASESVHTISETFPVGRGGSVFIDFPVGELVVEGSRSNRVEVDLTIHCRESHAPCLEQAERVRVVSRTRGGRRMVEVQGFPTWKNHRMHLRGTIWVPAQRPLEIDMGVGKLEVRRVAGDLVADLGVGEVTVSAPHAGVRSAHLHAKVGEVTLWLPDGPVEGDRSLLIGSKLSWAEGPGAADLAVHAGVGEVMVRLER